MNCMNDRVFIDTNVLVYSVDRRDPQKHALARERMLQAKHGWISTQVLQEFYVSTTGKLRLPAERARHLVRSYRERFDVVVVQPEMIERAIDWSLAEQLSFWDALILASADSAKCGELWTEDLNSGQTIRGVKIVNPFGGR
jgi:predicted nucleic acid-binding protein